MRVTRADAGAAVRFAQSLVVVMILAAAAGCDPPGLTPIPASTCGDGVVEGVETCELGRADCNEDCQVRGEPVQRVRYAWGCRPTGVEVVEGTDPVVLCTEDGVGMHLARVDALGRELWHHRWSEPGSWEVYGVDIAVDEAGAELVVAGTAEITGAGNYGWLRKYAADGSLLWTQSLQREDTLVSGVCIDGSSDVYVIYSLGRWTAPEDEAVLAKLDGSTGAVVWKRGWRAEPYGVLACTEAGPVAANEMPHSSPDNPFIRLRAYDQSGQLRWTSDYDPDPAGVEWDPLLAASREQGIVVGARSHRFTGAATESFPLVASYDLDGVQRWAWEGSLTGTPRGLALGAGGEVYVYTADIQNYDGVRASVMGVGAGGLDWAFASTPMPSRMYRNINIARDDIGRVVVPDAWDEQAVETFELVWLGQ